jgi:hypothetical protein
MNPHKTAITRTSPSRPCVKIEPLLVNETVIDYGCGKGYDTFYLNGKGIPCKGYDKYNPIFGKIVAIDRNTVVMCNFVLNTIPQGERIEVLKEINKAKKVLLSVRTDKVNGTPHLDGVITSKGTFQTQLTVKEWIEFFREHLGEIQVLETKGYLLVCRD